MSRSESTPTLYSRQTLYRYSLGNRLGKGGFGEVFRGHLLDLNKPVALKRFRRRKGSPVRENWAREYLLHSSLSHPSILQVLDAFEDDGYYYIVTERAKFSLDANIDDGLLWSPLDVIRAGMQISSALHYLHVHFRDEQPLLHRDVTPKNIFYFQRSDTFKLGDFGISKLLDDVDDVAVTQIANWGFVAPELVRARYTDPQSDLYQLGLVLYAMASGGYAVDQRLSIEKKKQAIADGLPFKQANALEAPLPLKDVIKGLLFRNTKKRYQTASEVFKALYRLRRLGAA